MLLVDHHHSDGFPGYRLSPLSSSSYRRQRVNASTLDFGLGTSEDLMTTMTSE